MVVILLTGPICAQKEAFAKLVQSHCNYQLLKVTKCVLENLWDFENKKPITDHKEEIIQETKDVIEEAKKRWKEDIIIYPIYYPESIEEILKKRSYFRIVNVVSPLLQRLERFLKRYPEQKSISEEEFITIDDYLNFEVGISKCASKAEITIKNTLGEKDMLTQITGHSIIFKGLFRPEWDVYFMELAHIVRQRSNCMKRSVGAIIVQGNRIVSTGYNGTPGRITNCFEGGCERCNQNKKQGEGLDKCNCIHAEENSVLECGVHRAKGATIYTTLAPCRWCTKILIQAGVKRVVYDEDYSMEGASELFQAAGIEVDCVSVKI